MGKWRHYAVRGGTKFAGALAPMGSPDWSLTVVSASEIDLNWPTSVPQPADRLWYQFRLTLEGSWPPAASATANPYPFTGLESGHEHWFRVAWGDAAAVLSEWSDVKSATTL